MEEYEQDYKYEYEYYGPIQNACIAYENVTFWAEDVKFYAFYVIGIAGIICNIIALVALLGSAKIRKSPSGVLLISLTLADTLVLITERLTSLSMRVPDHILYPLAPHVTQAACGLLWFSKYSSRLAASLIFVCISVNRFLVVVFPLKSRQFTGMKCALIQMLTISVVSCLLCLYSPFTTSSEGFGGWGCDIHEDYEDVYFIGILIVDVVLCDMVSSLVVTVLTVYTIVVIRSKGKEMIRRSSSLSLSGKREAEDQQVTLLLIAVCVTFAVLRIPYVMTWIPVYLMEPCAADPAAIRLQNAFLITHCVALLNHAINLFLYCVFSASFRSEYRKLCQCCPICRFLQRRKSSSPHQSLSQTGRTLSSSV